MQTFGQSSNDGGSNGSQGKVIQCGSHNISVVRASSLPLGTHLARFYPLSPDFYQGADYPYIVQSFHWINRQPVICRRTSYDYTVPDAQDKPLIDTQCPICREKFALYAKAKELGYTKEKGYPGSPPASVEFHKAAKALNERFGCSSLVSFVENNMLAFPVIITYGKELMDQIQFHANRIEKSSGVNICDPQKGYMFEIIIGNKPNSRQRDYKQSLPSMNGGAVDITGNAWKWEEVCHAIKSEIVPIPTPDQVIEFYQNNQAGNQQSFIHPALQNSNPGYGQTVTTQPANNGQVAHNGQVANPVDNSQPANNEVVNPVNNGGTVVNSNPGNGGAAVNANPGNGGTVVNSNPGNGGAAVNANPGNGGAAVNANPGNGGAAVNANPGNAEATPAFQPATTTEIFPCHASKPDGSGYDEQDATCKSCTQAQTCSDAKNKRTVVRPGAAAGNANPGNGGAVVNSNPGNGGAVVNSNPGNGQGVADDVQSRLSVLNNEIAG
jgi:hypothetical protein